jgi:hypothetical protein
MPHCKFLSTKRVRVKLCKALLLPYFGYYRIISIILFRIYPPKIADVFKWLSISGLDMCLVFVVMTTFTHAGMNSWVCLYLIIMISFSFKWILMHRPGYLFADHIGARSVRTSNFIFPSVCPGASVLVRGIRL